MNKTPNTKNKNKKPTKPKNKKPTKSKKTNTKNKKPTKSKNKKPTKSKKTRKHSVQIPESHVFSNLFSGYQEPLPPPPPVNETKEPHRSKLVLIHATWCGHCKHMLPNWHTMTDHLIEHNKYNENDIHNIESEELYKLDDINKKYVIEEDIRADGFPTMGKLINGRFEKYQGNRDTDSLIQWAGKQ